MAAARAAFPGWAATPPAERAHVLHAIADGAGERLEEPAIVGTDAGSMLRVKGSDTLRPLGPGLVTDWEFRGIRPPERP